MSMGEIKRQFRVIAPHLHGPRRAPPADAPAAVAPVATRAKDKRGLTPWGLVLLRLRMWQRAASRGHREFERAPRPLRLARDAGCEGCPHLRRKKGCRRGTCGLKGCGCEDFHTAALLATCPHPGGSRWPELPAAPTLFADSQKRADAAQNLKTENTSHAA
jgi:hypothetical protein